MNTVESLRLVNLRCLRDTGLVQLRPLTFLVGNNSSGKSSFLRSLPLLRQSVEARTAGPILWYGNYVDFGNFAETISAEADPMEICFEFKSRLHGLQGRSQLGPHYYRTFSPYPSFFEDTEVKFLLAVNLSTEERTAAKRWTITIGADVIEVTIDQNGTVTMIKVNQHILANQDAAFHLVPEGKIFQGISRDDPNEDKPVGWIYSSNDAEPFRHGYFEKLLIDQLSPYCSKSTTVTSKLKLITSIPLGSREQMWNALRNYPRGTQYWKRHFAGLQIESADFEKMRCLFFASKLSSLLFCADNIVTSFAREIRYIAPVRATVERYYRTQGLATDEIDPQGKNLAMYLQSLTYTQRLEFSKWTEEQIGFSVKVDASGDHLQLRLQEVGSSQEYNMTDMGFGFSQVLPILAQIWATTLQRPGPNRGRIYNPARIVAIEQPELHLHPRLQAKVVDLFAAAVRQSKGAETKLGIIAETHSESMVNRLGQLIVQGKLDSADVQVLVFNKPTPESRTNVLVATFTPKGELLNWPLGFFLTGNE